MVQKAADVTDLFLFDVKHMDSDRHYQLTGVRNELILDNLRWLFENRRNVKVRVPLLKGVNDGEREIETMVRFLEPYKDHRNCKGIDLLPYHKMGVNKYAQPGARISPPRGSRAERRGSGTGRRRYQTLRFPGNSNQALSLRRLSHAGTRTCGNQRTARGD